MLRPWKSKTYELQKPKMVKGNMKMHITVRDNQAKTPTAMVFASETDSATMVALIAATSRKAA
jgi:hypothetical protein